METPHILGLIRKDDEENFNIAGKEIEVPIFMRDLYWQMDEIRRKSDEELSDDEKKKLLERVHEPGSLIKKVKENAKDNERHFLGMVNDGLMKVSLKLQWAIKKERSEK